MVAAICMLAGVGLSAGFLEIFLFMVISIATGIGVVVFLIELLFNFIALIYELPYWFWKFNQPYDKIFENDRISWLQVKNATKVYISWIIRRKPKD